MKQLSASFEQASASVDGLTKQLAFQEQRLEDIRRLSSSRSVAEFREQDTQAQYDTVHYQLVAAKAAQENARLAMESEVGGEPLLKQKRSWSRRSGSSSRLPSPDDGYVSSMAAAPGAGALIARSVMSFIIGDEIAIVGMFQPNGFPVIKNGAKVRLVFGDQPGRRFETTIAHVPRGIGQGQIAVSGVLVRTGSIGGANAYPAVITIPKELTREQLFVCAE